MPIELHTDCGHCRVQGAVLESWDEESACGRLGLPVTTRCRLCARSCEARLAGDAASSLSPNGSGGTGSRGTATGCPTCGSELDDDTLGIPRAAASLDTDRDGVSDDGKHLLGRVPEAKPSPEGASNLPDAAFDEESAAFDAHDEPLNSFHGLRRGHISRFNR